MRPSVEKSLLLALGLAVCASSLDGLQGRGPMAQPVTERLRSAAAELGGAAAPRLVLLPPVAPPSLSGQARAWPVSAHAIAGAPGPVPAGSFTLAAEREAFLRRVARLVEAGSTEGRPGR